MIEKLFVKNLKKLRNSTGLTQFDMAENAGVSPRYYQRIESGESWPPPKTIRKLAKALKIGEADLFVNDNDDSSSEALKKAELTLAIFTRLLALDESKLRMVDGLIDTLLDASEVSATSPLKKV